MAFDFSVVLAHGALGYWDEAIFIGVALLFFVLMGISWVQSRNNTPDEVTDTATADAAELNEGSSERFRLD